MNFNVFMRTALEEGDGFWRRLHCLCKDGFTISIQASSTHHCVPNMDYLSRYASYELGYPSEPEPLIAKYAEDKKDLTQTVYPYVPRKIVLQMIAKHGGIERPY